MKTFVEADNMREKQEDMLTGGIMSGQSGWRAKKAELMVKRSFRKNLWLTKYLE